jgi:hypothetical protein
MARGEDYSLSETSDIEDSGAVASNTQAPAKHIGLVDAIALVIGVLVGSGIFSTPVCIPLSIPRVGLTLLAGHYSGQCWKHWCLAERLGHRWAPYLD